MRLAYEVVARQSVPPSGANNVATDLVEARLAFLANGGRSKDLALLVAQLPKAVPSAAYRRAVRGTGGQLVRHSSQSNGPFHVSGGNGHTGEELTRLAHMLADEALTEAETASQAEAERREALPAVP